MSILIDSKSQYVIIPTISFGLLMFPLLSKSVIGKDNLLALSSNILITS